MKEIRNKTSRPLRIPLPGGKALFVGPSKVAQIGDAAVEHASIKKLVEDGSIEIVGSGDPHVAKSSSATNRAHTHGNTKSFRRGQGDR